jgi:hypothetical protein
MGAPLCRADFEHTAKLFGVKLSGRVLPEITEVCRSLEIILNQLVAGRWLTPEQARRWHPSHSLIHTPLFLDTNDPEADAEQRASFRDALDLHNRACKLYDKLAPIERANEFFMRELGRIWLRDKQRELDGEQFEPECRVDSPATIRAIMLFRNLLWMQCGDDNLVAKAVLHDLDCKIDSCRDLLIRLMLDRVVQGRCTAEEGKKMIAALTEAAESGQLLDPEGDIDRAEARAAEIAAAAVGFV